MSIAASRGIAEAEGARESWRDHRRARINAWFTEHVATLTTFTSRGGLSVTNLRWAKPGTGMYSVNYQTFGHRLVVAGDIGYGIYVVSEQQPLDFWASCDIGYFASKCVASPEGRGYKVWDDEAAREALRELLRSCTREQRDRFRAHGGFRAIGSAFEWSEWIRSHGHHVWRDAWEMGDLGSVVGQECEAHLVGLKLAMAQVRAGTVSS